MEDEAALDHWRKVLPNTPDEAIVIPRYHAKRFPFPLPGAEPSFWNGYVRHWLFHAVFFKKDASNRAPGPNPEMRHWIQRKTTLAAQWWSTFKRPTALELNQQLYTRHDKWKEIENHAEFLICWALCVTYLNTPEKQRDTSKVKNYVVATIREMHHAVENGYTITHTGELTAPSQAKSST